MDYHLSDGTPCSLFTLVRQEPEWAANVIRNQGDSVMDTESKVDGKTLLEHREEVENLLALVHASEDTGNRASARHYLARALSSLASISLLLAYPADEEG